MSIRRARRLATHLCFVCRHGFSAFYHACLNEPDQIQNHAVQPVIFKFGIQRVGASPSEHPAPKRLRRSKIFLDASGSKACFTAILASKSHQKSSFESGSLSKRKVLVSMILLAAFIRLALYGCHHMYTCIVLFDLYICAL